MKQICGSDGCLLECDTLYSG